MSIYVKKDTLDREKVFKKFEELKDMPPETAKPIFDELWKTKTWSELEYKDLTSLYATYRIALERKKERENERR